MNEPWPLARCPSCGQVKSVRKDGTMWAHYASGQGYPGTCAGGKAGVPVPDPAAGSPPVVPYGGILELMRNVVVIPRYTLHAHPSVMAALKAVIGAPDEEDRLRRLLFPGDALNSIDVFPEQEWEPGRYELRRNGDVIMEGKLADVAGTLPGEAGEEATP